MLRSNDDHFDLWDFHFLWLFLIELQWIMQWWCCNCLSISGWVSNGQFTRSLHFGWCAVSSQWYSTANKNTENHKITSEAWFNLWHPLTSVEQWANDDLVTICFQCAKPQHFWKLSHLSSEWISSASQCGVYLLDGWWDCTHHFIQLSLTRQIEYEWNVGQAHQLSKGVLPTIRTEMYAFLHISRAFRLFAVAWCSRSDNQLKCC